MTTSDVLLRRPATELPADIHDMLGRSSDDVLFAPLQRQGIGASLIMALVIGTPTSALFALCVWLVTQLSLSIPVLLGVVAVMVACFGVLVAQVFRVRAAVSVVRAEEARLRGDEGFYRSADWLMLVRSPERVSLLPRSSVSQLMAVRVRYRQGTDAFCVTYPCALLDDGREVLMRTPRLAIDVTLEELLDDWGVPVAPTRLEVTDRQLDRFQHL
ncbi:MAG: hypothetical protein ACI8RZ_005574 [Myxococcota bacterium]|jgi:hypothetical protein